jgi:methionine synthase I (cobalamin-dependent)
MTNVPHHAMSNPFRSALAKRVLLFDGAMGTAI